MAVISSPFGGTKLTGEDAVVFLNEIGETITITTDQYRYFQECESKLLCLERNGVDNWEGYDVAMQEFYGEDD